MLKFKLLINRGRMQAQGTVKGTGKGAVLEESVPWATNHDYSLQDALLDLKSLKKLLTNNQRSIRKDAFARARDSIVRSSQSGGIKAEDYKKKSFAVRGTKSERVDVEVLAGKAFVPVEAKIAVLF